MFIGFSFFLILSATILIGLLFRLGIERRAKQVGLLSAVGYTPGQVRSMFLKEGTFVVVLGGLLGVAAAIGYAHLMIHGLKTWWIGAIGTRFLDVYITPMSLVSGFAISVVITLITIWWALRQLKKLSTRDLLSGEVEAPVSHRKTTPPGKTRVESQPRLRRSFALHFDRRARGFDSRRAKRSWACPGRWWRFLWWGSRC